MTTLSIIDDIREGDLLSITPTPDDRPGHVIARVTTRQRFARGKPGEKKGHYIVAIVLLASSEADALSGRGIYEEWRQADLDAHHAAQTGRRIANPTSPRIEARGPNEIDGLALKMARR